MQELLDILQYSGRFILPVLAVIIILRCFFSLLGGETKRYAMAHLINSVNGDRIPLDRWETSVGRSKSCDIIIGYGSVSRFHAVISRRKSGWYITDTFSKTGTRVNGKRAKSSPLFDGDVISFGNASMVFSAPLYPSPEPRVFSAEPKRDTDSAEKRSPILRGRGENYRLLPAVTTIGRDEDCSIVLLSPSVSRHHARITASNGEFFVEDCGSKAGTILNGKPLTAPHVLKSGDEISIAEEVLIFDGGSASSSEGGIL